MAPVGVAAPCGAYSFVIISGQHICAGYQHYNRNQCHRSACRAVEHGLYSASAEQPRKEKYDSCYSLLHFLFSISLQYLLWQAVIFRPNRSAISPHVLPCARSCIISSMSSAGHAISSTRDLSTPASISTRTLPATELFDIPIRSPIWVNVRSSRCRTISCSTISFVHMVIFRLSV